MSLPGPDPYMPKYINDGKGRDTYISLYNGGFTRYPYSKFYKKDVYEVQSKRSHQHDLFHRKPIIKYNMDGKGRDFFIYQNILSEHCKIKEFSDFPHTLRNGIQLSPIYFNKNIKKTKLEKNLINRLFYGNCPGLKDRLMEPKVKFNKNLKYNYTCPGLNKIKSIKDKTMVKNKSEKRMVRKLKYNVNLLDEDNIGPKKITMSTERKKFCKDVIRTDSNINGKIKIKPLQSLFLVNRKNDMFKEIDLPPLY